MTICIAFELVHEKHRKNCECCHHHSLFKGHNVIVNIVVLNCQKCNQCLMCQVSGYKSLALLFEGEIWMFSENQKFFQKSEIFPKIWNFSENLKFFLISENFSKIFCQLITLITCLKGSKSLRMLYGSVFQQCGLTDWLSEWVTRSPIELSGDS